MKDYIYLIREREFIRLNENIYKIDKFSINTKLIFLNNQERSL